MLGPKYSFWWTPKPITGRRSTRAQKGSPSEPYRNVMHDKRVIRGSNYGGTSILADLNPFEHKASEIRRRNILRKKILARNQRNVLGTPPPAIGRRHEIIQTEKYLEELLEHPPVRTTDTQTDLFLEKPPTPPPFVASKIGVDAGTSIEEGDLPPIEEDSSSENESSLIERFVEACIFDIVEEIETEVPTTTKSSIDMPLMANEILQSHVAQILPTVLEKLEPESNAARREQLMETMCPWLSAQIAEEVAQIVDSHEILTVIIEQIIKQRGQDYAEAAQLHVEMFKTEVVEINEKEKENGDGEIESNEDS